jgi:hypothetical protein
MDYDQILAQLALGNSGQQAVQDPDQAVSQHLMNNAQQAQPVQPDQPAPAPAPAQMPDAGASTVDAGTSTLSTRDIPVGPDTKWDPVTGAPLPPAPMPSVPPSGPMTDDEVAIAAAKAGLPQPRGAVVTTWNGEPVGPQQPAPAQQGNQGLTFKGTVGPAPAGTQPTKPAVHGAGGPRAPDAVDQANQYAINAEDYALQQTQGKAQEEQQQHDDNQTRYQDLDKKYGSESDEDRANAVRLMQENEVLANKTMDTLHGPAVQPNMFEKVMKALLFVPGVNALALTAGAISQAIRGDTPADMARQTALQQQTRDVYKQVSDMKSKLIDQFRGQGDTDLQAWDKANTAAKNEMTEASQGLVAKYQGLDALRKWNDDNKDRLLTMAKDRSELKAQGVSTWKTSLEAQKLQQEVTQQNLVKQATSKAISGQPLSQDEDQALKTDEQMSKHYVPTLQQVTTPENATAANAYQAKAAPILQKVSNALQFRKQHGATIPGTVANRQAQAIGSDLRLAVMADEDFKRLSPESQKAFSGVPNDIGAWGRIEPALSEFQTLKQQQRQAVLGPQGLGLRVATPPPLAPLPGR